MTGSYFEQSLELYVDLMSKSGATKLVGENLTQQFETGLFRLKLLVWFALEEESEQFGLVYRWNSKWMELVWFLKYINNKIVWCDFGLVFKLLAGCSGMDSGQLTPYKMQGNSQNEFSFQICK